MQGIHPGEEKHRSCIAWAVRGQTLTCCMWFPDAVYLWHVTKCKDLHCWWLVLILVDTAWCWLLLIVADWCLLMLIDAQIRLTRFSFVWAYLRSFSGYLYNVTCNFMAVNFLICHYCFKMSMGTNWWTLVTLEGWLEVIKCTWLAVMCRKFLSVSARCLYRCLEEYFC